MASFWFSSVESLKVRRDTTLTIAPIVFGFEKGNWESSPWILLWLTSPFSLVPAFRAWKIHFWIIDFTSLRWRSMNNWAAWNIASIVLPIKSFDDGHSCRTRNPGKHCDSKNDCTSHSQVNRRKNSRAEIYVGTCRYRFVNVQHLIGCEHVELKKYEISRIESVASRSFTALWTQLYPHGPTAAVYLTTNTPL